MLGYSDSKPKFSNQTIPSILEESRNNVRYIDLMAIKIYNNHLDLLMNSHIFS
ncbi:hypothetical protein THOD04_130056 [Vibrio owensii]|nr:hypothetical protein THOD04_130056 [Vibrio owensii]